jgi:ApbE superfamily uncharacterized protein (UPF0280 family)
MSVEAVRTRFPDGRWHFQHGPIDLIILAEGEHETVEHSHELAWRRFRNLLHELVQELPLLRAPVSDGPCPVQGPVARRMWWACAPLREEFITPMAAVAGAVADTVADFYRRHGVRRAAINNGGDIALVLAPGEAMRVGIVADAYRGKNAPAGEVFIQRGAPGTGLVGGVATSGWRGRSQSLGIADAVTVLAASAAEADAAATLIANAVNVTHRLIERRPATQIKDDTDLGERLVTVKVPPLPRGAVAQALRGGARRARHWLAKERIAGAALLCQGQARIVGAGIRAIPPIMASP